MASQAAVRGVWIAHAATPADTHSERKSCTLENHATIGTAVEGGECTALPFLHQTQSCSSALAIVYLQISHQEGFSPLLLVYIYLFHLLSIPFWAWPCKRRLSWLCSWFSSVRKCVCSMAKQPLTLVSAELSRFSLLPGSALRCVWARGVRGMTVCWPGRGPSARPLGKLACTLSGNFHYLPTGQNDFGIDRGFIMSAIPFFENMGKTEKEWWQGGGNSISS